MSSRAWRRSSRFCRSRSSLGLLGIVSPQASKPTYRPHLANPHSRCGETPRMSEIALVSGEFWGRNPHAELEWLRRNDPVHWDEAGQVWGITTDADVRAVSKQPELFSNAGGIRPDTGPIPMMIDMDDPEHWRRRKLVHRGFTPARVRAQAERIRSVVDGLIDAVCEQGECDFVADIAAWLPLVM